MESDGANDSVGVEKAHRPESLGMPGWLRVQCNLCLALGSRIHQVEEVLLRCHLEELVAGSSGLSPVQSLLLREHLHS